MQRWKLIYVLTPTDLVYSLLSIVKVYIIKVIIENLFIGFREMGSSVAIKIILIYWGNQNCLTSGSFLYTLFGDPYQNITCSNLAYIRYEHMYEHSGLKFLIFITISIFNLQACQSAFPYVHLLIRLQRFITLFYFEL